MRKGNYMDSAEFWSYVERARTESPDSVASQAEELRRVLRESSAESVAAFDIAFIERTLELYTWDLWGVASQLLGGCSDDSFADVRSWVVAQGREFFESCRDDPMVLAGGHLDDPEETGEAEHLSYVAAEVYTELTGRSIDEDYPDRPSPVPAESPEGAPWDEDDDDALSERFPGIVPLL